MRTVLEQDAPAREPEVNPTDALLPFRSGVDGPWDRAAAAHLARRAGFGMAGPAVERALELGPERAAADLLARKPEAEGVEFTKDAALRLGTLDAAQGAWAYRMLFGVNPCLEKLALFWHGHFATSALKVDDARLMMRQIDLFREKGSGPFIDLLSGVARDPAMLLWLDGNSNRRGKPNENFARELFELFSLGIGNYTEDDIKEAARAFTGWHARDGEFWFNERAHDTGSKKALGRSGSLTGDDILQACVENDASSAFISAKLFEYYVHPAPGRELRRELQAAYKASGQRTGDFLVKLLSSRVFHSRRALRSIIASPADYVIGALRTIGARASAKAVVRAMASMGQEILAPPSVKGWVAGEAWLSSTTLLCRYGFAMSVGGAGGAAGLEDLGVSADWGRLAGDGPGAVALFFPEGLSREVEKDLGEQSGGDARTLVMGCLQAPECQFL